jgi:hypothetical protein
MLHRNRKYPIAVKSRPKTCVERTSVVGRLKAKTPSNDRRLAKTRKGYDKASKKYAKVPKAATLTTKSEGVSISACDLTLSSDLCITRML